MRKYFFVLLTLILAAIVVRGIIVINSQSHRFYTQFQLGWDALTSDYGYKALYYWLPIAEDGYLPAQTLVAELYAYGENGVIKNQEKALYWCSREVIMGIPDKQITAEVLRHKKSGCALLFAFKLASGSAGDPPLNINESIKWLKISYANGNEHAYSILDTCIYKKEQNENDRQICLQKQFRSVEAFIFSSK